jgi:hypothetical protein
VTGGAPLGFQIGDYPLDKSGRASDNSSNPPFEVLRGGRDAAHFSGLLDTLLPHGGMVFAVHAFFDESITPPPYGLLCVAGYLIESEQTKKLVSEWQGALDEFNVPYFRMSNLAHGTKQFSSMTMEQRIALEKRLIGIIKRRVTLGIAITVNPRDFERVLPPAMIRGYGSEYTFCTQVALAEVARWAEARKYQGDVAYFFESGHAHQSEANRHMTEIATHPELKKVYRYGSHSFADKKKLLPLQAADLLAWQWTTDFKRQEKHQGHRLDVVSLMETPHIARHCGYLELYEVVRETMKLNHGIDIPPLSATGS